jgi:carboxylate-amine ligase
MSTPALPSRDTTFCPGGEFTVGAEDELLLVDADGQLASGETATAMEALDRDRLGGASVSREVYASQVEFNTPVCPDAEAVAECLHRCRSALRAAGHRAVGTGLHPTAELGRVEFTRAERYDAIVAAFGGVLRTPTSAFQVHVGLPDQELLVAAYRGIRNQLPVLRALAAGSPFWHGRDSGLASARAAIIRSYPRGGIPPVVRSYGEYEARVAEQTRALEVPDYTYLCWDARPHPRLGTLEVRVMDAQCSLDHAAGLVALVQGLARSSVERPPRRDLPSAVLAEQDFRAIRHGLDTCIVDVDGTSRPLREVASHAIEQARAVLGPEGKDGPLGALSARLSGEQEPDRHRRIHQRDGMGHLLHDLVSRTTGEPATLSHDRRRVGV